MERQPRTQRRSESPQTGRLAASASSGRTHSAASGKRPASASHRSVKTNPAESSRRPASSASHRPSSPAGRSASARRPQSAAGQRPRSSAARQAQRRRQAALRKKRRLLAIGAAAAIVLIAVILLIVLSIVIVPKPKELAIESSSTAQVLTWKGKPKHISYLIYRKSGNADYELAGTVPEETEPSFVSRDLDSATLYEYKVVAVKGSGEKARESKGELISAYTLPLTVTNVKARTMSKDSLTLSWPDVQPVDAYEVRYGASESLENAQVLTVSYHDVEKNETDGTCAVTIPNLKEGTSLFYSIRSVVGEEVYSEWSDVASGKVTRAIDMTGIDVNKPMVALTFDDGPDNGKVTGRILDALNAVGGHATFFQLGQLVESYPEVAKRIVDEGHQIACHTYDHEHMGENVTVDDIVKANDAIEKVTGVRPDAFRAPGGAPSELITNTCKEEGQAIYHWIVDTLDWKTRDADSVVNEVESHTTDGDIILMHNIYASTADAAERVIPWLVDKGYQLVTVDQLVQAKTGEPPVPGRQYYSATYTSD